MKNIQQILFSTVLAGGLAAAGVGSAADSPATNAPAESAAAKTNAVEQAAPDSAPPDQPAPAPDQTPQPAATDPANTTPQPAPDLAAAPATLDTKTVVLPNGEPGLMMNFHNVPLEMVLNYMSTAAGFIIHPANGVSLRGNVEVWSNQAMSKEDAVKVLEQILTEKGYGLVRNEQLLTIDTREHARTTDTPVKLGNEPDQITKDAEIVTQIIPVRSLNAVQLVKDLAPLVPSDTLMTPNDAGNSLIMTDTRTNIRRIVQIIRDLDSVSASINSIKVFPLRFADAKSLVAIIEKIFPAPDSSGRNGGGGLFGRFRGGGGGGGGSPFGGFNPFGGGGGGGSSSSESGHTPNTRVSATSDDHSNSLIVSAPEELLSYIQELVTSLDTPVEAITEVHVFHLHNADATEMADLITNLFPDDTGSADASRQGPQFNGGFRGLFGGFGGPGGGRQGNNSSSTSQDSARMKLLGHVSAVPDRRTASLVVTAATNLMPSIITMVQELDDDPARKQQVFVMSLQNADPSDALQVLQNLFQSSSGNTGSRTGSGSSSQQNSPLTTRQNQAMQNSSSSSSPFGSGFGSGGGGGGGRGAIP